MSWMTVDCVQSCATAKPNGNLMEARQCKIDIILIFVHLIIFTDLYILVECNDKSVWQIKGFCIFEKELGLVKKKYNKNTGKHNMSKSYSFATMI